MQIEGLKVTDYIKTEGVSEGNEFGVGTGGIKDDNKANFNHELRALSIDNAFYNNKGKMTDEEFSKDVASASSLGMSTVDQVKNIERTWDEDATAKVREDGFDPMDMDSHTLVTVVDEIKMNLAKAGKDISKMGGLDNDEIRAMSGSIAQAMEMTGQLSETLPVEAQAFLVKNQLEPTITNIYNAQFSAPVKETESISDEEIADLINDLGGKIDTLIEQVENEQSGKLDNETNSYDVLKDTISTMIKMDVPVTKENLEYMVELDNYEKPAEDQVISAIEDIVAEDREPAEAYLVPGYSLMDQARMTFEEVMGMDPNALKDITAQRQLVEIQLSMTVEATFTMMKNGIEVNTADLSDLLDKLKMQETSLLQILMKKETGEESDTSVKLFKEVMNQVAEIESAPAATLGRFSNIGIETFSVVHEVSMSVTAEYSRMEATYEAVGTEVRQDLGDNITKAFRNVDDILEDLDIEITETSQKAVRILAYNQMDINAETVNNMKSQTELVGRTFKGMTPAVVSEMIKRGDNPLDLTFNELNEKVSKIKAELGSQSDTEGFAKFLWKAEHTGEISEEQRQAYIGVYRLLHQVDKSDGAAIGVLISQGQDITLRNLMTAIRSSRHTNREYKIDDDFGELDRIVVKDLSITEQIEKVFQTNRARDAKEAMSPVKMQVLGEEKFMEMTPDEFADAMEKTEDDSSEAEYIRYTTDQLKAAVALNNAVDNILEQFNIPNSANMITAVNALVENNSNVMKNLYERASAQQDMDIRDMIDMAFERFAEACHTPEEMAEAQEALGALAENVMKTMLNTEDVRTIDMDNMKLVVQQTKAMERMATSGETYHIPIMVADEAGNMNLRIVRGDGESGLVKMALHMESTGTISTTFHYESGSVKANIECETLSMRQSLEERAIFISEVMESATGFSFEFSFTRNQGISVNDIYNWQLGNFVEDNSRENKIQTQSLYGIARSYIDVIGKIFGE